MRGYIILMGIFVWVPILLLKPHVGVLVWDWVSHMNPHRTAANIKDLPILDLIAGLTIIGLFISKEPRRIPAHPIIVTILIYFLWTVITTMLAYDPVFSSGKLTHLFKIVLFVLITTIVMQSPIRLKAYYWVMALSVGFFAIKGGLFSIVTGGMGRVQGGGGMLNDNNQLAMVLSMMVPVAYYLYLHPPFKIMKWPMFGSIFITIASVIGTQSRGGLIAVAAVSGMLFMNMKHKLAIIAVTIPLALVGYQMLPDRLKDRYATIDSAAEEDASFRGRVAMWKYGVNVTDDYPIAGGGFDNNYIKPMQDRYLPYGFTPKAFHSVYFEVLGEHGYTGLILFLTIAFTAWYSAGTIYKQLKDHKDLLWLADMARTLKLSVLAYCVGGLTVNIATLDLFYDICGLIALTSIVGNKILAARTTVTTTFNPYAVKEAHKFYEEQQKDIKKEKDPKNPFGLKKKKQKKKWSPHDPQ